VSQVVFAVEVGSSAAVVLVVACHQLDLDYSFAKKQKKD
jgi:hypothetical protein